MKRNAEILKAVAAASYDQGWEAGWKAAWASKAVKSLPCDAAEADQQRHKDRLLAHVRMDMSTSGFKMEPGNRSLLADESAENQYDSAVIPSNSEQWTWQHEMAGTAGTLAALYDLCQQGKGRGA